MTNNRGIERPGGFPRSTLRRKNRRLRRPPPLAEGKSGCRGESRQQNQRQQRDPLCSGGVPSPTSLSPVLLGPARHILLPSLPKKHYFAPRPPPPLFVRVA